MSTNSSKSNKPFQMLACPLSSETMRLDLLGLLRVGVCDCDCAAICAYVLCENSSHG